jgi:hypothetical protein
MAPLRLVKESRDACRLKHWLRAVDRCDEARTCVARLRNDKNLVDAEVEKLASHIDDLNLILRSIEKRLGAEQGSDLSDQQKKKLDDLIVFLSGIEGRLRGRNLEI